MRATGGQVGPPGGAGQHRPSNGSSSGGGAVPRIDGFEDLVPIGRGGFSSVYAATQLGLGRQVAIKVLDPLLTDLRRFERECRTLGALSGARGIVPVLQTATTESGQPCIVMQLMDGGSLADRLRGGQLPVDEVLVMAATLCRALQRAHDARVHHRDIKPENVLFHDGDAAIADFGIALVEGVDPGSQTVDSLSPPHAPPERFLAVDADPVAGDVYSLGSTIFTALAGWPPFGTAADGGLAPLVTRITCEPVPAPDRTDVPAELFDVLAVAMSKDPGDRFPSMPAFGAALEDVTAAAGGGAPERDRTVRRTGPTPTVIRAGEQRKVIAGVPPVAPVAPPPMPSMSPASPAAHSAGLHAQHSAPVPLAATPERSDRRSVLITALWSTALVLGLLSASGVAYLLLREEPTATAQAAATEDAGPSTATDDGPAITDAPPSTTVSTTTPTSTAPPPTTVAEPSPTVLTEAAAPSTTEAPSPFPASEATTAVDLYLEAASGFDTDAFAQRWAYPIEYYYNDRGVGIDEATLRARTDEFWPTRASLDFRRVGPTTGRASAAGWETSTDYRAETAFPDGRSECQVARIHLGFDPSWRVRTVTEERLGDC